MLQGIFHIKQKNSTTQQKYFAAPEKKCYYFQLTWYIFLNIFWNIHVCFTDENEYVPIVVTTIPSPFPRCDLSY